MSFEAVRSISLLPGAAIVQRTFVVLSADGKIDPAGANADAIGVALEAAAADGDPAIPVALFDGAKVEVQAGAAISVGDAIASNATGQAITSPGLVSSVDLGYALEAAGGIGEFITVILTKRAANPVNAT